MASKKHQKKTPPKTYTNAREYFLSSEGQKDIRHTPTGHKRIRHNELYQRSKNLALLFWPYAKVLTNWKESKKGAHRYPWGRFTHSTSSRNEDGTWTDARIYMPYRFHSEDEIGTFHTTFMTISGYYVENATELCNGNHLMFSQLLTLDADYDDKSQFDSNLWESIMQKLQAIGDFTNAISSGGNGYHSHTVLSRVDALALHLMGTKDQLPLLNRLGKIELLWRVPVTTASGNYRFISIPENGFQTETDLETLLDALEPFVKTKEFREKFYIYKEQAIEMLEQLAQTDSPTETIQNIKDKLKYKKSELFDTENLAYQVLSRNRCNAPTCRCQRGNTVHAPHVLRNDYDGDEKPSFMLANKGNSLWFLDHATGKHYSVVFAARLSLIPINKYEITTVPTNALLEALIAEFGSNKGNTSAVPQQIALLIAEIQQGFRTAKECYQLLYHAGLKEKSLDDIPKNKHKQVIKNLKRTILNRKIADGTPIFETMPQSQNEKGYRPHTISRYAQIFKLNSEKDSISWSFIKENEIWQDTTLFRGTVAWWECIRQTSDGFSRRYNINLMSKKTGIPANTLKAYAKALYDAGLMEYQKVQKDGNWITLKRGSYRTNKSYGKNKTA